MSFLECNLDDKSVKSFGVCRQPWPNFYLLTTGWLVYWIRKRKRTSPLDYMPILLGPKRLNFTKIDYKISFQVWFLWFKSCFETQKEKNNFITPQYQNYTFKITQVYLKCWRSFGPNLCSSFPFFSYFFWVLIFVKLINEPNNEGPILLSSCSIWHISTMNRALSVLSMV